MSDRLFDPEDYPEVPIFAPPRRKSLGDARHRGEYPPEWDTCQTCGGSGHNTLWSTERLEGAVQSTDGLSKGLWGLDTTCPHCLGMGSLKGRVRLEAGHRCIRCGHPYITKHDAEMLNVAPSGKPGGWSQCDGLCTHGGPMRVVDEHGNVKVAHADPLPGWHWHIIDAAGGWKREAGWRVLTVHHADCDKSNVRWWNLLALCQVCHLTIQHKVVMERVWPHKHSEWFQPYVAGYYAWVYLGEDLTREETMARRDELLALERM